uniref:CSON001314 protein n=1 Tax=Culicoides sonorensis TaxID=179676 RepID=A0A336LIV6_CULSO
MGLTTAASVSKLSNTDVESVMAPALTEPVTQSDISGQSPRPGDSITNSPSSLTTITGNVPTNDTTIENSQPNILVNNGKYPKISPINGKTVVINNKSGINNKEIIVTTIVTDDIHTTTNGVDTHMDQKNISDSNNLTKINNDDTTASVSAIPNTITTRNEEIINTSETTTDQNNVVTSTTRDDDDQTLSQVKSTDSQTSTISNLGLQNFSKESAEVEQMLGDLAASGEIDLMSVFKTLDSAPVSDAGFDLASGLSLFNDVDVMNVYEETVPNTSPMKDPQISELRTDIEKKRQQMQRKCDFLLRRLRKLQARYMTQHASEEIVGLIEHCQRYNRRKEREIALGLKPVIQSESNLPDILPYQPPPGSSNTQTDSKLMPVSGSAIRNIIKKLETSATNQKATFSRRQLSGKYFQSVQETSFANHAAISGTVVPPKTIQSSNFSCVHRFDDKVIDQVDQVAGLLHAELRSVERAIDSDATASSSGGESADEMIVYSNTTQQNLQISRRAAWRYARDRSSIASRWTWLLAQISDLEYRIRQHNDLYQQIKKTKGSVQLEGEPDSEPEVEQSVNGYRGVLPGGSKPAETEADALGNASSARTRAFIRGTFRKRKLLQTSNLHTISKKAAKSSTIKCGCYWPIHPCALCTGRSDPTAPRDLPDTMPESERIALVDAGFHPVLSFPDDVTQGVYLEAIMRVPEWQNKVQRYTHKQASKAAERASNPAKYGIDGELRQKRSMKKVFRECVGHNKKKLQVKFGFIRGKYRKKQKTGQNNNNNNRVKFSQMFKNSKIHVAGSSLKQRKSSHSLDGYNNKKNNLHINRTGLMYNDGESGGSGNNSSRSKNASPTPGVPIKGERTSDLRRSRTSYDIDNIIIPYSVAAQTRVEVLPYKEIPTPKWNIIPDDEDDLLLSTSQEKSQNAEILEEDISDDVLIQMHERALVEERKKFASVLKYPPGNRPRINRRTDSHADSSGTNTPINPTSPGPAVESGPPTPMEGQDPSDNSQIINALNHTVNALTGKRERRRTSSMKLKESSSAVDTRSNTPELKEMIPPYEPRLFPLPEHVFEEMLADMPRGHKSLFDSLVISDYGSDLIEEEKTSSYCESAKSKKHLRTNNNSISYQDEEHLEELDDDEDSDRNSVVERLLLLEKAYDEEKLNNQDYSAAETESVDTDIGQEEEYEDPNDPEWFEKIAKC